MNTAPAGLLQPPPVSNNQFNYWTADIITGLPEIDGFHALVVRVDKFGKLCWLITCRAMESKLNTTAIVQLFFDNVVQLYGVPWYILHICNLQFTAHFWHALWKTMGYKTVFAYAYHP